RRRTRPFETLATLAPQGEVLVLRSARSARLEARALGLLRRPRPGMTAWVTSLRLDLRELDHLRPALGLLGDELAEFRGRQDQNGAAHVLEPPLDLRIGERGIDLAVEQIDDFRGRLGRRANSGPAAAHIARHR